MAQHGAETTEVSSYQLDEARQATEGFAGGPDFSLADISRWLVDADARLLTSELRYLLGLADRCADLRTKGPSADGLGIPKTRKETPEENLHEFVGQVVLDGLEDGWAAFGQDPRNWSRYEQDGNLRDGDQHQRRRLAAVLHRASWALSQSDLPLTHRATDLTRVAKWMETEPHALLSLRCSGLVYSKQNRYVPAWLTFSELRLRLSHYEESYRTKRVDEPEPGQADSDRRAIELRREIDEHVIDMFREVQQQTLLAETGTAARTVERLLVDWIDKLDDLPARWRRLSYHEAFNSLRRGTLTGGLSSEEVASMRTEERKSVTRAAIPSWKRRPGVMTARCHLELATLALVVGDIGIKAPPGDFDSWERFSTRQFELFEAYYQQAHSDETIDFDAEHVRELVQLRLHAALLRPAWELDPVENPEAPTCLRTRTPHRDELADWLRGTGNNANVVLSISAPEYLAWMQIMSDDYELLDWIENEAQDSLRRDAHERTGPDGEKVRVRNDQDRQRVVAGVARAREILKLKEPAVSA